MNLISKIAVAVLFAAAPSFVVGQHSDEAVHTTRITGQVKDVSDSPIPAAAVRLGFAGRNEIIASTLTDDGGYFTLQVVQSNAYEVRFTQKDSRSTTRAVKVEHGRDVELGTILMAPTLCGDSEVQPSCMAFSISVFSITTVAICFLSILGMLVMRRKMPPLLIASGALFALAVLSLILPAMLGGNKFAGAILVLAAFPFFLALLIAGIICFCIWSFGMLQQVWVFWRQ